MIPCARCHALTATRPYGTGGLLWLCEACPLHSPCGEYQHQYAGSAVPGKWICSLCGCVLTSQAISTEVVRADIPQTYDVYC